MRPPTITPDIRSSKAERLNGRPDRRSVVTSRAWRAGSPSRSPPMPSRPRPARAGRSGSPCSTRRRARTMSHKEIVAVARGQARPRAVVAADGGRRVRAGQGACGPSTRSPDGFEISRVEDDQGRGRRRLRSLGNTRRRAQWLPGAKLTIRKATENKTLRVTWGDGSNLEVSLYAKGAAKTQIAVQHGRLEERPRGGEAEGVLGRGVRPPRAASRVLVAPAAERPAVRWAFLYFFAILCGYYILRPLRDEMGIVGGVKNLPWQFTATFVVMLLAVPFYSAVVARFPRRNDHPRRLPLLRDQPARVPAARPRRRFRGLVGARLLRLGFGVQPLRRVRLLELHGGHVPRRAGEAPLRGDRRRRQPGSDRGPVPGGRSGEAVRASAGLYVAAGAPSRSRGVLRQAPDRVGGDARCGRRRARAGPRRSAAGSSRASGSRCPRRICSPSSG